jgi:hypothetical protein
MWTFIYPGLQVWSFVMHVTSTHPTHACLLLGLEKTHLPNSVHANLREKWGQQENKQSARFSSAQKVKAKQWME